MNTRKRKPRFLAGFLTAALALTLGAGASAVHTYAAEASTETEAQTEIKISMKSSIETPATPASLSENTATTGTTVGSTLNKAQGLSLSTAAEETAGEAKTTTETVSARSSLSMAEWIVIQTVSLTLSGLILLGAGAGIVYFFRRNWNRWGGEDDDE